VRESNAELLDFEEGESTTVTVAIARQHASVRHQDGRKAAGRSLPSLGPPLLPKLDTENL
jgi:large subunit ribosomal protein L43